VDGGGMKAKNVRPQMTFVERNGFGSAETPLSMDTFILINPVQPFARKPIICMSSEI
jgi:hypothetical protein